MTAAAGRGLLILVLVVAPSRATADDAAAALPVSLELSSCAGRASDIRRMVAMELRAELVEQDGSAAWGAPDRGVTQVNVTCRGRTAELRVVDPVTGKSLRRTVDLGRAGGAQSRLVALAIAELVSASWTELETNPDPIVPPVGPRAPPETRSAALDTVRARAPVAGSGGRTFRLTGLVGTRAFSSGAGLLWGGGIRFAQDRRDGIAWAADARIEHGSVEQSPGSVSTDSVSAGGSVSLLRRLSTRMVARAGVGLRAGIAGMVGEPAPDRQSTRGSSVHGLWGGPTFTGSVTFAVGSLLMLEVGAEVGWVLLPVRARVDGGHDVAIDGPTLAIDLGVGIAP